MGDRIARLVAALGVLLAVGVVALGAVGGWLYWNGVELTGEQTARQELAPLAQQQIPKVFC